MKRRSRARPPVHPPTTLRVARLRKTRVWMSEWPWEESNLRKQIRSPSGEVAAAADESVTRCEMRLESEATARAAALVTLVWLTWAVINLLAACTVLATTSQFGVERVQDIRVQLPHLLASK